MRSASRDLAHQARATSRRHASIRLLAVTAGYAVALVLARRALDFSFTSPWFVLIVMICLLGWFATARPLFLPRLPRWLRPVRRWESRGNMYRVLGVPLFGRWLRRTPLRALNLDVYLSRHSRDSAAFLAQLEAAETAHLWDAVLVVPYMVYAGAQGWWAVLGGVLAAQLGVNVYPILHLRSVRGRLTRVNARKARLEGRQAAGG